MAINTREHIIKQSAELFNRLGYAGASMADIMKATGLKKGGIYNHFESKEQLALEAFDYAMTLVYGYFTQCLQTKKDASDRLLATLDLFQAYAEKPILAGGCPLLNTAIEADDTNPALKAKVRIALDDLHAMIVRICEKGIERGQLNADCKPQEVASVFLAMLEGAVMLSHLYDSMAHMNIAAAHLRDFVLNRLKKTAEQPVLAVV